MPWRFARSANRDQPADTRRVPVLARVASDGFPPRATVPRSFGGCPGSSKGTGGRSGRPRGWCATPGQAIVRKGPRVDHPRPGPARRSRPGRRGSTSLSGRSRRSGTPGSMPSGRKSAHGPRHRAFRARGPARRSRSGRGGAGLLGRCHGRRVSRVSREPPQLFALPKVRCSARDVKEFD
jgi:hypothetical protein